MREHLQILFSKEYKCWMPSLWYLQDDCSLISTCSWQGNWTFYHRGWRNPWRFVLLIFLFYQSIWRCIGKTGGALPALFLLAVISLGVIFRHHAMSRYTVHHLNLGSLTCIVKTLSPLCKNKGNLILCSRTDNFFLLGFPQMDKINGFRKYNDNWSLTWSCDCIV